MPGAMQSERGKLSQESRPAVQGMTEQGVAQVVGQFSIWEAEFCGTGFRPEGGNCQHISKKKHSVN